MKGRERERERGVEREAHVGLESKSTVCEWK